MFGALTRPTMKGPITSIAWKTLRISETLLRQRT